LNKNPGLGSEKNRPGKLSWGPNRTDSDFVSSIIERTTMTPQPSNAGQGGKNPTSEFVMAPPNSRFLWQKSYDFVVLGRYDASAGAEVACERAGSLVSILTMRIATSPISGVSVACAMVAVGLKDFDRYEAGGVLIDGRIDDLGDFSHTDRWAEGGELRMSIKGMHRCL
jgi:hypothetical protein